jgi:hypothetical protein
MLTGAEYYSALSNRPDLIKGIDDEALHKANIVRLGRIIERKAYFQQKLTVFDRSLDFMKARYLSSRNRQFSRLIETYKAGRLTTEKYYSFLDKYIRNINENPERYNSVAAISRENYPQFNTCLELARLQKHLRHNRIAPQLQELMQRLKSRIPFSEYRELLQGTNRFSKADDFYFYLARVSRRYHLDDGLPDVKEFLEYTEKNRQLNPVRLIEEERRLVEEIRIGLSGDISELEVSFLADSYGYFREYLLHELSADDYDYFKQKFEKFKSVWKKYSFEDGLGELAEDFKLLNDFYETNCARNDCFLKNISLTSDTQPHQPAPPLSFDPGSIVEAAKNSEIIVVVTGGFHTRGLEELMRERKLSYLCVTPNVTQDATVSNGLYADLVKQQAKLFETQSIALALGSMGARIISVSKGKIVLKINGKIIEIKPGETKRFNFSDVLALIRRATKINERAAVVAAGEFEKIMELSKGLANPIATAELIVVLI